MGGKFINTNRTDIIQSSVENVIGKLDNPYVSMIQEKGTKVIWFNRNDLLSTVDEGSKLEYEPIGPNSPTKYNKINNLMVYGLKPTGTTYEVGDFGIDTSQIIEELTILPDTITPYMGDYFIIPYMQEKCLFKVTEIQSDTLKNNANYYKVTCVIDGGQDKYTLINKQIADTYDIIFDNIGTNYKSVIKSESYKFIENIDNILITLKKYYKTLFYNHKVQTMTFNNTITGSNIYDPYMIEFLIRNNILSGDNEYLYIGHQTSLDKYFEIEYDKCFLHCVETKDLININKYKIYFISTLINDITSIFDTRFEDYFKVTYNIPKDLENNYDPYCCIDSSLFTHIINNELYKDENTWLNIIVKYFNSIEINTTDLKSINDIEYNDSINLFFYIPMLIFAIESYVKSILLKH